MGLFENSHFPYTNFHEMNMDKLVETVENAAGQAESMGDRMTAAESDINALELRADGTDNQITLIHGRLTRAENDIDALEARATTSEGDITALTTRVTAAEGDIDALDTRITTEVNTLDTRITNEVDTLDTRITADEATIATQATQIAGKSTVDVDQILAGGVRIGTITVDGTPTTLYAPTAGSTVVRAEDVPFNNQGVTPSMTAVDCQQAIVEVNTNTGSLDTRLTTAEGNITTLQSDLTNLAAENVDYTANPAMWAVYGSSIVYNPQDVQAALDLLANDLFQGAYTLIKRDIFYEWIEGTAANTITEPIVSLPFSGMITTSATEIYVFVPYTKIWNRHAINPIDNAQRCQFSLTGTVTVRGVDGYIINTKSVADSSIRSINVNAYTQGYQIIIKLATAASTPNNTPVSVYFQNNAKLTVSIPRT